MVAPVTITVPYSANYKVRVRVEAKQELHTCWLPWMTFVIEPGHTEVIHVTKEFRISLIEKLPLDTVIVAPPNDRRSITINEDAHGG